MRPSFLIRRILRGVLVLWIVHLAVFLLIRMIPGDPAVIIAGDQATPDRIEQIREGLGLSKPLLAQYWDSLSATATGDLGKSLFSGVPVSTLLADAVPPTLSITLLALLFAIVVGVALGSVSGLNHGRLLDRGVSMLASLGIAMPGFWVGMMLVTVFSFTLHLFPATSYTPISDGVGPWLLHVTLPSIALGTVVAAEIARHARGGVIDVLNQPYVNAARARGSSGSRLIRAHVARNAAVPVLTVLGLSAAALLGGTVIIENVFAISGLGNLAVSSVLSRDYPVIQGYVLLASLIVVVVNIIVDVLYGVINPKVRSA